MRMKDWRFHVSCRNSPRRLLYTINSVDETKLSWSPLVLSDINSSNESKGLSFKIDSFQQERQLIKACKLVKYYTHQINIFKFLVCRGRDQELSFIKMVAAEGFLLRMRFFWNCLRQISLHENFLSFRFTPVQQFLFATAKYITNNSLFVMELHSWCKSLIQRVLLDRGWPGPEAYAGDITLLYYER